MYDLSHTACHIYLSVVSHTACHIYLCVVYHTTDHIYLCMVYLTQLITHIYVWSHTQFITFVCGFHTARHIPVFMYGLPQTAHHTYLYVVSHTVYHIFVCGHPLTRAWVWVWLTIGHTNICWDWTQMTRSAATQSSHSQPLHSCALCDSPWMMSILL